MLRVAAVRCARACVMLAGGLAGVLAEVLAVALLPLPSHAAALRYCDAPATLSAQQQDRLLRFAAVVKETLAASGQALALLSRSGLDLGRFGHRYSHAGIGIGPATADDTTWSVRQLYFACDEARPRLFDQGLAGFVLGTHNPELGFVSVLLLPPEAAAMLHSAAQDKARGLALLAASYSANAHAFSAQHQNCNQWLAELLASAWGSLGDSEAPRAAAQAWLKAQGYEPSVFDVGASLWPAPLWMALAHWVPWLHSDDHPEADLARGLYRVSMPASIDAFVRAQWPATRRIELCHDGQRIVVRQGWRPIADGCVAASGDTVLTF